MSLGLVTGSRGKATPHPQAGVAWNLSFIATLALSHPYFPPSLSCASVCYDKGDGVYGEHDGSVFMD